MTNATINMAGLIERDKALNSREGIYSENKIDNEKSSRLDIKYLCLKLYAAARINDTRKNFSKEYCKSYGSFDDQDSTFSKSANEKPKKRIIKEGVLKKTTSAQ